MLRRTLIKTLFGAPLAAIGALFRGTTKPSAPGIPFAGTFSMQATEGGPWVDLSPCITGVEFTRPMIDDRVIDILGELEILVEEGLRP